MKCLGETFFFNHASTCINSAISNWVASGYTSSWNNFTFEDISWNARPEHIVNQSKYWKIKYCNNETHTITNCCRGSQTHHLLPTWRKSLNHPQKPCKLNTYMETKELQTGVGSDSKWQCRCVAITFFQFLPLALWCKDGWGLLTGELPSLSALMHHWGRGCVCV